MKLFMGIVLLHLMGDMKNSLKELMWINGIPHNTLDYYLSLFSLYTFNNSARSYHYLNICPWNVYTSQLSSK